MGSTAPTTTSAKTRSPPPQSLPPGSIAQAQAQFPVALTTQLQLQVNTKASATSSPPTLFLVPATPGLSGSGISKPSTADPSIPNPSTLSKHKGLPVLPYLVTPKEEKTHGTILGLWEYDDSHPSGKPPSKVAKSSKGAPSTSGSSKVVTSMGAEAGRRALLALQSVVAEEGGPISSGGPRRKASTQQLALPLQSSSLSIASAPVSPHKDRDVDSTGTGMSQNTPFESISLPATPTACENRSPCLPENGFFLAVMSVYWSNLVGPRIEQILNGEVMRTTDAIEPKMVVLQDEGLIAMSYLYTANPSMTDGCSYGSTTLGTTTGTLAMSTKFVLSFVVPLVYLQNFSSFFGIMSDHAPVLIEVLRGLRAGLASHIALGREGDQVFGREFINRAITSHLQTNSSTVVVGNNITIMNMMINTLALFLSAEDRAKSCHARKQHRYLPNLFLQGIYTPSIGKQSNTGNGIDGESGYLSRKLDRNGRLYHILSSPFPTTIVDTVRCKVEQTERLPKYSVLRSDYRKEQVKCVVERSISRVAAWNASSQAGYLYQGSVPPQSFQKNSGSDAGGFWSARRENSWTSVEWKGQKAVRQIHVAAPMVENLVRCVVGLPIEMREGYVRQWRRGLVKRALTVVKFVKKEGVELAEQLEQQKNTRNRSSDQDFVNGEDPSRPIVQSPQTIFQHLGVDSNDL
ncbi:hypothetical protein BGZ58_001237, partial [Dissophora ornata]